MDKILKEILACPECHGDVLIDEEKNRIKCKNCKRIYPIVDGIPVMLVEESYFEDEVKKDDEEK